MMSLDRQNVSRTVPLTGRNPTSNVFTVLCESIILVWTQTVYFCFATRPRPITSVANGVP